MQKVRHNSSFRSLHFGVKIHIRENICILAKKKELKIWHEEFYSIGGQRSSLGTFNRDRELKLPCGGKSPNNKQN